MPKYRELLDASGLDEPTRRRVLERLLLLRKALDVEVPRRSADQMLLATWNIREFDSAAYGWRGLEPLYYIAEIISHFDLVALAEVRADLEALEHTMELLGPHWQYLVTDVTAGTAGNSERLAVLYDTRTVTFGGLSGELVLPPLETTDDDGKRIEVPAAQFARTPLLAGFHAGWMKFMLGILHVRWGDGTTVPAKEVRQLVDLVVARETESEWAEDLVLLGDFNIGSPDHVAWEALREHDWTIPPDFVAGIRGSNVAQDKYYDQIALKPRPGRFELGSPVSGHAAAGVFNFFDVVYRPQADFDTYVPTMQAYKRSAKRSNFRFDSEGEERDAASQRRWYRSYWRTHQMSDHLPLWVSLRTDYTDDYLRSKATEL